MKMMVVVMMMKNVVMTFGIQLSTTTTPFCFCSIGAVFFMSHKDNFNEIRSGLHILIFDILFADQVLYRSYVLRHHLLLSVLCS